MKKKTINAILTGVNIALVIAIIVLLVKIGTREPLKEEPTPGFADNSVVSENMTGPVLGATETTESSEPEEAYVSKVLYAVPHSTTSVNVRSGPGTEFDRIGSAYTDCEYEVIEAYDSGWTKLYYDGSEGFISSEFLSYKYKLEAADGTFTYEDVPASAITLLPDTYERPVVEETTEEITEETSDEQPSEE